MAEPMTLRRSPLMGLEARAGDRVHLIEVPYLAMVGLRLDPHGEAAAAVGRAIGVPLPTTCGQVSSVGHRHVLWLGPDEWLVVSDESPAALLATVSSAVDGQHAAVVDLSANRTTLELTGQAARAVLEKGCPADLHPRSFGQGKAIVTTLARVPVLLWQVGPGAYWVMPRSSLATYVSRWITDAMVEFG
ncbi:MAG: sarcosine oxidase subunit gamma [Marmoricola sp.]